MLGQVSWTDYLQMITSTLAVYYAFIVTTYYRHDLMHLIKGKQKISTSSFSTPGKTTGAVADLTLNAEADRQNTKLVQALTDEIQALVFATGTMQKEKKDILLSLQQLLNKYPTIKVSSYKSPIEHFIITEYANNCSVHLSEAELKGVWI